MVEEPALPLAQARYKGSLIMISDLRHQRSARSKKSDQISLKELIPTVPKKASGILLMYRIIGGSGNI